MRMIFLKNHIPSFHKLSKEVEKNINDIKSIDNLKKHHAFDELYSKNLEIYNNFLKMGF